jgi:hypothetical protein
VEDEVDLIVTLDGGYAVWGQTADGQVGVVHCFEWSAERPIPEESYPRIGDRVRVKVMRVVNQLQSDLPSDATHDGRIHIDFVGSIRLVGTDEVWAPAETSR